MTLLKFFRHKYFAVALSSLFLVFSCTTHGIETTDNQPKSIDYSTFNSFKTNINILNKIINDKQISKSSESIADISQGILDQVNLELGANLAYPETALLLPDHLGEEIIQIAVTNGWIDDIDINLINSFMNDLENSDFTQAMSNFENTIQNLEVSNEKFEKLNLTANLIQSAYYDNPNIFENLQKVEGDDDGWFDCALATVALASATAGLASCATVAACALAVTLHYNALKNFGRACLSGDKPQIIDTQNN